MRARGRCLFIIHDLYQSDIYFPLGVGYLSAVLQQAGAEVGIYDMAAHHFTNEELALFLDERDYDLIGVSFLASRYKETVEPLLRVIGDHKKDAWLIVGGHGPSSCSEFILRTTPTDVVAIGEAEETIVELLDSKVNSGDRYNIEGIAYKTIGANIINERRPPPQDLDAIPYPAWELFDMDVYTKCLKYSTMELQDRTFSILTSRGCVGKCSFCFRLEKGLRLRNVKNVVKEMEMLQRYGVTFFNLADEYFATSIKGLNEFKDELEQRCIEIKFQTNVRVDQVNRDVAELLKDIGCTFLNIGFESMDQHVLDLMNKGTTVEQNESAAKIVQRAGIGLGLNLIWGCPGDTADSLKKNVAFIKKWNTYDQLRTIRPVTSYPGTPLYYQAIEQRLLSGPEDFFNQFKNSDLITINFTDLPINEMYPLLFNANKELIIDHCNHTKMSLEDAKSLIQEYRELYFVDHNYKFRGSRHYDAL